MALFAKSLKAPLVTTLHGPIGDPYRALHIPPYPIFHLFQYQITSERFTDTNFINTVYNGIDVSKFLFRKN